MSARTCRHCGYRLLEDHARPPQRNGRALLPAAGAAVLLATVVVVAVSTIDGPGQPRAGRTPVRALEVLSDHPLSARAMERLLERRFISPRHDDTAAARCSRLVPKPAHAIRRCEIRYPSGLDRIVILLTDARGREVLAELR